MSEARIALPLVEDFRAFVDHRIDAAFEDLLVADLARIDAALGDEILDDLLGDGRGLGVAIFVVVVVARIGLLAAAVHFAQHVADGLALRFLLRPSRCRGRPDRSSRTGPSGSRNRRARGRCPRASRLRSSASAPRAGAGPGCGCRRSRGRRRPARRSCRSSAPVCIEVAITGFEVLSARTTSRSRMTLAGEKKCRPITASGRLVTAGDFVDVERRGVGGEDRALLARWRRACGRRPS